MLENLSFRASFVLAIIYVFTLSCRFCRACSASPRGRLPKELSSEGWTKRNGTELKGCLQTTMHTFLQRHTSPNRGAQCAVTQVIMYFRVRQTEHPEMCNSLCYSFLCSTGVVETRISFPLFYPFTTAKGESFVMIFTRSCWLAITSSMFLYADAASS